ncbi:MULTISPECIES: CatB-related O-acetyltransferase [unclassified Campylobacter]|uniref:CatB-related O-acetyltransferase n=1 Tax=unclassified Campylobacter TaxID=2593542 RepID=UPI0022EA0CF6|nr:MULTISPECIES: CatB-related O-acetyltransferase [unclassified Campylobacter]MDA3055972.1 CatB-related O-acetyltransferase [Campylobacter sp. CN_NA1]MDA3065117.1 CatB-related O-acetyltransferase [Campylobacter sp. CN_NE4]MDA3067942.1 CatB-related O-acetyltransferase [Campylobacter sp. CN_NE3]MDA3082571.1 CatB-related O-acetyltransferase [Campylobacter sp. CN_EL2]MDA3083691.1 CatB-related O-acetyltransferase [Campylobacter sp. CN_NE1]
MKTLPNWGEIFPLKSGLESVTYIKPTIKNKNIIVGEFSYYAGQDFEKQVTHHYDFIGDRLIIGKFCQIGAGVEFMMNGANHAMSGVSTFPFYIFKGFSQDAPSLDKLPIKGDTVVGNDVWIGQNSLILPGAKIGDGVIIGASSVVGGAIPPYSIVAGNPARLVRKRFDDEMINLLLTLKWWDKSVEEIENLTGILSSDDLQKVKEKIKEMLENGEFKGDL